MSRHVKIVISGCVLVAVALGLGSGLEAQTEKKTNSKRVVKGRKSRGKPTRKSASTKSIDVKVQRFQESFVREAAGLANQYEEAGNLVKTRRMLELILKLSPEVKGVRAKIKQIDEEMLVREADPERIGINRSADRLDLAGEIGGILHARFSLSTVRAAAIAARRR